MQLKEKNDSHRNEYCIHFFLAITTVDTLKWNIFNVIRIIQSSYNLI